MIGRWLAVLALILGPSLSAFAKQTDLYAASTLESSAQGYSRSTSRILEEVIWPALRSNERAGFGRRPMIEFPLFAEGQARRHPLAFYVPPDRDRIVMPIHSLKFLDDLCTAYAWLQINGFGLENVSEYTAMLAYGQAPSGGFPPPLEALGIPADALDDRAVDELTLGHFVTARTFILLHEMGHLLYGHSRRTPAESVRNEAQADRFAAEVMQRTSLPPLGALVFLMADAHWSGFPPSGSDTHPLSGQRVRRLADHLDDESLAESFRAFAALLDDPDIRSGFAATGKAGDWTALAPRRRGELLRRAGAAQAASRQGLFNGYYRGELVQFLDPTPFPVEVMLERRDRQVHGTYSFGLGLGTLKGEIDGNRLYFDWAWANNEGRGVFEVQGDGFAGTWGYGIRSSGAGTWSGRRMP